jgi:hypothetical protein
LNLGDNGGFDDLERAVSRARELRSYDQLQSAINNRMTHEIAHGRLTDASESLAEMRRNQEVDPVVARKRWTDVSAIEIAYVVGDWDKTRALIDVYLSSLTPDAPHLLEGIVRVIRLMMLQAEGDLQAAAEEAAAIARAEDDRTGDVVQQVTPRAAWILLAAGRRGEAEVFLEETLARGEAMIGALNDATIVETGWLAFDLGHAAEMLPLVEGRAEIPWAVAADAICAGDFRRAAEVLAEIGYRPGEAYARLRAARQLVEEGRRAEADVELQRSLAFWREVGATRYVREGEALLAASA